MAAITPPRTLGDALAAYREGLARGELLVARCPDCGHLQLPPRPVCGRCSSAREAEWVPVSGRGRVWSHVVFHKRYLADGPQTPYSVAVVALDEGPRLITNVITDDPADVRVGLAVEAVFERGESPLVKFKPRGE
jgi:uncharacterized OB-fold protein